MKTRIDAGIEKFAVDAIDNGGIDEERLQELLDYTRKSFGLDIVYVLERISEDNIFSYKCMSFSKPEYDVRGQRLHLPDDEYEAALHMYDDDQVCGYNLDSVSGTEGVSDCVLHYGFVRKRARSYDGSIGFQSFTSRIWTEEERDALRKLGNLCKSYLSLSIVEDIEERLMERLRLERAQYRDALVEGSEYSFSFDVTEGLVHERVVTAHGIELAESVGLDIPFSYDEMCKLHVKKNWIRMRDEGTKDCVTCKGLIQRFREGNTNPEYAYYYAEEDIYIRVMVYMYEDRESKHIHGLVVANDVTASTKREEAQKKALEAAYEAANQANDAKTKFLSSMSHDIRTPMNGIIGMTAIAAAHIEDRNRVSDCLVKITSASKHLLGLINEVLDMSKIESGKVELQNEDFSLPEFFEEMLSITKPQLKKKHQDFSVSITGIKHERVIGDGQRLRQALMNLISNAVKYTQDGGKIKLAVTEKPVNKPKFACYEFIIEDNGIGMTEEFLSHLYEPFSRANDLRVNQTEGTGLGMSITKSMIQLMNGSINVESEVNKGTKFTVTVFLGLQDEEKLAGCEKFIDLPILVADDDEDACESTCLVLSELGMKGEYVLSGGEAIEKVEERHRVGDDFFAVILDWKMPELDGIQTTREIRRRVGDGIPIIILSAYDWSDIETEARQAGANTFISKPLFKSRLTYLFRELLDNTGGEKATSELEEFRDSGFTGSALLVEDNELNAEIAEEILKMAGLRVDYAADGKEALEKVSKGGRYDIIFMDIRMPVMDGYEATRLIRGLPLDYAKDVPIIAMTANAFAEDAIAAKKAGMNEHISKPIDLTRLRRILNKWLI